MTTPVSSAALSSRFASNGFALGSAAMVLLLAVAPFVGIYPVFLMKALCFALFACAFNLLLGFGGLLSFGHAMFLGTAGYLAAHAAKVWGFPPELAILTGTAASAALGVVVGALAIRRQGIYFAMITLAIAQMVYFFYLQTPFTHGEDGIQAVPRGKLFGIIDLADTLAMYYVVLAIFGGAFRARRRDQGDRVPARFAHRCVLDHVGRSGADDAARRHGDDLRSGRRCIRHHWPRELPGRLRRVGYGDHRSDLRGLRARFPPRHCRPVPFRRSQRPVRVADARRWSAGGGCLRPRSDDGYVHLLDSGRGTHRGLAARQRRPERYPRVVVYDAAESQRSRAQAR